MDETVSSQQTGSESSEIVEESDEETQSESGLDSQTESVTESESEEDTETESVAGGWCYSPDADNENAEKCLLIGFNMAKCKSQRSIGCAWMEQDDDQLDQEEDEDEEEDVESVVEEEDDSSPQVTAWCESNSGLSTMKDYCSIPQSQEDCEAMTACYWVVLGENESRDVNVAESAPSHSVEEVSSEEGCCMISPSESLTS